MQNDLTSCDHEPIHIPGSIQPHGMLLVLDPRDLNILNWSRNIEQWLGVGQRLNELFDPDQAAALSRDLRCHTLDNRPLYLRSMKSSAGDAFHAIAHRNGDRLMLELEAATEAAAVAFGNLYPFVHTFLTKSSDTSGNRGFEDVCRQAAVEVRKITGFDRVLIYRFEPDWTGIVIAEDRNDRLPSYFDLRFPASDIPRQARELYRVNRLRIIPDANYQPVPLAYAIDGETKQPVDLSFAVLRSVSPVHLEYMRNMETMASMSISILKEGALWGLISCHNREPRTVPIDARTACDLLGQMLSLQITAIEQRADAGLRIRLKSIENRLLSHMAEEQDFLAGLTAHSSDLMAFANAQGAAVIFQDSCHLFGQTPSEDQVVQLVQWLSDRGQQDVFSADSIVQFVPEAAEYAAISSGVLAIAISKVHRSYILWFRPEVIQTVKWAGDARKAATGVPGRISPRQSFELWKELVRNHSQPWLTAEIDAVTELRNAVVGIVLRRAEELADLSAELKLSNKELEAFSYSVSHDLRAPFRHIAGYAELLREEADGTLNQNSLRYLDTIVESAHFAGTLVDNLLNFSQIGRSTLDRAPVNMSRLVAEVKDELSDVAAGRQVRWLVGDLPDVRADLMLMRQVWTNLLSNALKYSSTRPEAIIEIVGQRVEQEAIYSIRDNGVGFDMTYADKLFGVFQRLHRVEEFEGTGIGLALVRRIVSRHGGRTWAEGSPNEGARFSFSLPLEPQKR